FTTGGRRPLLHDESVHRAARYVRGRVAFSVWPAEVEVVAIVIGTQASTGSRIWNADRGFAVPHRDPVCAWVRAEIGVERAVLLHDHDHVPDLMDPHRRHGDAGRGRCVRRALVVRVTAT